jgi:hypothetical protein
VSVDQRGMLEACGAVFFFSASRRIYFAFIEAVVLPIPFPMVVLLVQASACCVAVYFLYRHSVAVQVPTWHLLHNHLLAVQPSTR